MTDILKNKTFVITGETKIERDELKAEIMAYGGRVTIAPSGKTDYLVIGKLPGDSKLTKANKLKINKITENELLLMIEESKRLQSVEDVEFGIVEGLLTHENEELEEIKSKKERNIMKYELQKELWVEKYRPNCIEDFCGNKIGLERLKEFLNTPIKDLKKKGILLCGAPGIGKTTAAQIICKSLNKSILEFNASDVRNKNNIKDISLIRKTLNINKNIINYSVIIMDEVDGISDRGGLTELVNLIKNTKVHIICIANEKNIKLQTLINYVEEIHFRRLELRQIKNRIHDILNLEGIKINEIELNKLLIKGHGDFRFILNQLQVFASGHLSLEASKIENKSIFETVMSIFKEKNTINNLDYFFEDPDFVSLLMQENYIKPPFNSKPTLKNYFEAAEQLSLGEYNNSIKGKTQNYSFSYLQGYWTTRPTYLVGRCDFSSWLGQNSKRLKNEKLVKELSYHNKREELNSNQTYRLYKLPLIFKEIINLINEKKIDECIKYLKIKGFEKDDLDIMTIVLDKKLADSRLLKMACNKNPWKFSYSDNIE